MRRRVCIVSPGSLASNPRVLKEAQSLHGAGYDVTTVVCDYAEALRGADDNIVRTVPWTVVRVPRRRMERYAGALSSVAARLYSQTSAAVPLSIAAAAYGGPAAALHSAAQKVPADLYIAHYVVALQAAAAAASSHGGLLGFDAEDFHAGEGSVGTGEAFRMRLVRRIESAVLPRCAYVTAASPLIGKAYEKAYGVAPTTVLNVFPLSMAPETPSIGEPGRLRAYWFSQTIGLDRGLQAFLQAMARARTHVTLDVRGDDRWRHGDTLMTLARQLGIADRVTLLPLAEPDQMARLAAQYDLGLSLETETSESRRLCLTNKIFTYLLGGVPVIMSDTPAQIALAAELGRAAALISLANPQSMPQAIDQFAVPGALAEAKAMAWRLGRERYNWDREQSVLLEAVSGAFRLRGEEPAWRR